MSQRRVQIVILCEDKQQEVFARHFLKKRGFIFDRNFRIEICPKGAGEQFVRKRYPAEVKAYRSKNYLSGMLVVLIDADKKTIQERLKQLDEALIEDSQQIRQPQEAIAIFIPKRNIETWIHYLQGDTVDEETEYSKFNNESECKPYVENLVNQCYQGLDENAPPSLQAGCGELQRILPFLE
ncbi:MAG: hypothetical protein RMY36_031265 [Nostoc sp. SerVER01]|nr:hypothetical protein [Nostoc sp. SerVER01]MDZ8026283.1 hypothetical protein [Nostoc sp. DedQUE11]MDZ8076126.1 hypothetical protein [Nostoc sp. DedQUE01]MDZ8079065.1 hypothetical protein [Nostoc sp. DcaGUA01]